MGTDRRIYQREWQKRRYYSIKALKGENDTLQNELEEQKQKYNRLHEEFNQYKAESKGRIISLLKANRDFYISSWGGDYNKMPDIDKAKCDEIEAIILDIMNLGNV